jgi:hypothetical protein
MADQSLVGRIKDAVAEYEKALAAQNDVPSTAPVPVGGSPAKHYATATEQAQLRAGLHKLDTPTLQAMFSDIARRKDQGVPLDMWVASGGRQVGDLIDSDPMLRKTLDTTGAAALIRQDLEPVLYELFIREFPAWERFRKEPSNGLVHAYNRQTSFGDAQFMTELGTVTDDVGVYERATTPIAVIATRRGVTIKSQLGTLAGGAGFNPEQIEVRNGLRAIAHKMQKTIFQGNATVSGGTASTEDGLYDANSFDGLRRTLNVASATTINPFSATPEQVRNGISVVTTTILQAAGNTSVVYMDPNTKALWDRQQDQNVRFIGNLGSLNVGTIVNTVNTGFGELPLNVVPGDSIGTYTFAGGNPVADIYVLDESSISLPYLGTDGVTTLDIPIGLGGQLVHQFIMFGMWGLAVKVVGFNAKVRVRQT